MSEYAARDRRKLGAHYTRHVQAMTAEGLHNKSDIAAELAWRDAQIEHMRGLLLWSLYRNQGGHSDIGQPIRRALGIGQFDRLSADQIASAKNASGFEAA